MTVLSVALASGRAAADASRPQLSPEVYAARHGRLRLVLLLHVVAIAAYGALFEGWHTVAEVVPLVLLLLAAGSRLGIRGRATATALGLFGCSAAIVHLADGAVEAHFHFFFVLALVSLYEDLVPYLVGIGFVLVEHFVVGTLVPDAVFDHPGNTFGRALVHAGFVALVSAAHVFSWRAFERVRLDEQAMLVAEVDRLAAIVDSAGLAIFSTDFGGTVKSWNAASAALFGYDSDEIIGRSHDRLVPSDRKHEVGASSSVVNAGGSRSYDTVRLTSAGDEVDVSIVVSPVRSPDGSVVGVSVMARDITLRRAVERDLAAHQSELARQTEELARLAFQDPLTGLSNRALFRDRLVHALTRQLRAPRPLSVVLLDLDGFKLVNDSAGHAVGDELLRQVAARILGCVRSEDTVARLGGDEFALLIEDADRAAATEAAERIRVALAAPYGLLDRAFTISSSVGVAVAEEAVDADDVIRNADVALYAAKAAGKNCVSTYDSVMYDTVVRRMQLEADLRAALDNDQLELHFQPLVSVETGEVESLEALLRWQHPEQGSISPVEFIPIAEETGLIVPIGTWVLNQATAQAARLERLVGRPVTMSVNVSVRQLERADFAEVVAAALTAEELPPARLILEVTESALADDTGVAALHRVRATGVQVAIDDFGTGYSSLGRLRRLPVDELKIDRSFICEIDEGAGSAPLLAAIVAMGHTLGLRVVAEGVETEVQLAALRRLGCDIAQGFLLSRPVPLREIEELLSYSAPFVTIGGGAMNDLDDELLEVMRLVRRAVASVDDLDHAVPAMLQAACAVTGLETAFLTHIDWEEGVQRIVHAHNRGELGLESGQSFPWEQTICKIASETDRWQSDDVARDYAGSAAASVGLSSFCGVPLLDEDGHLTGTLCTADSTSRSPHTQSRQFLRFLAGILSDTAYPMTDDRSHRRSVVIVDKSDLSRRVLRSFLSELDQCDVIGETDNLVDAIHLCREQRPDIALIDVNLADGCGIDALDALMVVTPATQTIIVSGDPEDREAALSAGAAAFLSKDRVLTDLAAVLAVALSPAVA